jgi:hypothetical protein
MVSMSSPNTFTTSTQKRSWYVVFNFSPTWFSSNYLMTYSKAKFKSNGDKASPF